MPPSPSPSKSGPATRKFRLNIRALLVVAILLVVGSVAIALAWQFQSNRGRNNLLSQAKALAADKKYELAISYLKPYLAANPNDLDALDLRAEVLALSAQTPEQMGEVARIGEKILLLDPDLKSKRAVTVRRRLAEAYLRQGPVLPASERKYNNAEKLAAEAVKATDRPDAETLRLHARTLERLGGQERFLAAAARYEEARKLEPKDPAGAERLARLCIGQLDDPARGKAILDDLVRVNPSAESYLSMARVYSDVAADATALSKLDNARAARAISEEAIKKAVAASPTDLSVRVAAAEVALSAKRPDEARAHLDAVPEAKRSDFRYRTLQGIVDLYENKSNDAVENWKRGLMAVGGTEADLSWRLAYVLLQLGRVEEAEPLIGQFRRLVGGDETPPAVNYLQGLKLLKLNRPVDAINELTRNNVLLKVPPGLKGQYHYALGLAYEATRDEVKAMEEYKIAADADAKLSAPRLARARLLQNRQGEMAVDELNKALTETGEDPSILISLARLELRRQLALPQKSRDWKPLDALLKRGVKVAPASPALAIVRANALTAAGKPEAASDMLEQAVKIDKTDVDLWVAHAEKLVSLGKLDEALLVLDQASEPTAAGDQAPLRILRARILTAQGHGAEAREGLVRDQDKVRLDQRPMLWMTLGDLYSAQNQPADARKAFSEWSRLLPDDPLPRLFVLELALGDSSDDAKALVKESLDVLTKRIGGFFGRIGSVTALLRRQTTEATPETPEARQARLREADRLIDQIEREAPSQRYGHLLRGSWCEQMGEKVEAAAAYEKALKTEGGVTILPRLVNLYAELKRDADIERLRTAYATTAPNLGRMAAETYLRLGDKERAAAMLREVSSTDPTGLDLNVWKARFENSLGKPQEAEKTLRDLVAKTPAAIGPNLALMFFLVSQNRHDDAVKQVETMIAKVKGQERPEFIWAQCWKAVDERDRADSAYEAALSLWPDDPRVTRGAAEYFATSGRLSRGEAIFKEVLNRDKNQRWAARGLALYLNQHGNDRAAWRTAWDLVKNPAPGGDLPEDRLIRAIVLTNGPESTNRSDAAKMLRQLVDDLPVELPVARTARTMLSRILIKTDPKEAAKLTSFTATIDNPPKDALALHVDALIQSKSYDDAGRQLDRLTDLDPSDPTASTLRARLMKLQGKAAEATATLEKQADEKLKAPDAEPAVRNIIQILLAELEQKDAAERVARKLIDKYPKSGVVLATVLARQGKKNEALELYKQTITVADVAGVREAVRNSLALVSREKKDPETLALAESVLDAASKRDPKSPDLLAMAGYLRHFQDRYDDEIKLYEDALAGRPDDVTFLNNMAWTLSEGKKQPEQALKHINDAIARSPYAPPQYYDTRGVILTRLGKFKEAIDDLEAAVRDRPTGTIWAHLARAYSKANRMDDFRRARDEAKKAGLTLDNLDKSERDEIGELIFKN